MKASELRITNIAKCGEQLVVIIGIFDGQIHAKNIDSDYECVYEPITLSPL